MKRRSHHCQPENQNRQPHLSPTGSKPHAARDGEIVGLPLGTAAVSSTNEAGVKTFPSPTTSKAKQPRCRKVAARCRVATCSARPWYGQSGTKRPRACKDHRADGEVNVYAPVCQAEGCLTRPHYGCEGQRPRFCRSHKLPGMVDLLNKRCGKKGCNKQPSFSVEGGGRALFCKDHKEDGMFNTRKKACTHPGCIRIPSKSDGPPRVAASPLTSKGLENRGTVEGVTVVDDGTDNRSTAAAKSTESGGEVEAWGVAKYCAAHAPRGSVDVVSMRCREPGCLVQPSFGWEGSGEPAMVCARHRKKGMTDVKNPRCWTFGCVAQPRFARKGDPRPTSCLKHADPDMFDVRLTKYRKTEPPAKNGSIAARDGALSLA